MANLDAEERQRVLQLVSQRPHGRGGHSAAEGYAEHATASISRPHLGWPMPPLLPPPPPPSFAAYQQPFLAAAAPAGGSLCRQQLPFPTAAPASSSRPEPASTPWLLRLPPNLLAQIWGKLEAPFAFDGGPRNRYQHALRCTSTALARASDALISTLAVIVHRTAADGAGQQPLTWDESLEDALGQLSRFPAAATLTELRWVCPDEGHEDDDEGGPPDTLPALLPSFVGCAGGRLSTVRTLRLRGKALLLGSGDTSSLALALPHLSRLHLSDVSLVGPVFEPLSRLSSLTSLAMEDVAMCRTRTLGASLAGLTRLSELSVTEDAWAEGQEEDEEEEDDEPEALTLLDVLPNLGAMTALTSLTLRLRQRSVADGAGALRLLAPAAAARLTSLDFALRSKAGDALRHSDLGGLTAATALVKLSLPGATLGPCAILALTWLPQLAELSVAALQPMDCDLSSIPCGWRTLTLVCCSSPCQLTAVPTHSLTTLRFESRNACDWRLNMLPPYAAMRMAATAAGTLRRAAEILARLWRGSDGTLSLRLGLSCPAPHAGLCEQLLAALSPLSPLGARLELRLGEHWDPSAEHAHALAAALPGLRTLEVDAGAAARFPTFAAATASLLPQLRRLKVVTLPRCMFYPTSTGAVEESLLLAAGLRVSLGLPLRLSVTGQSHDQRARFNTALQACGRATCGCCKASFVESWVA